MLLQPPLLYFMPLKNKVIRIEEVALGINEPEESLKFRAASILDLALSDILEYKIVRKNIDSRQRNILFIYSVDASIRNIEAIKDWEG